MCVMRDAYCDVISGRVALGVWYTKEAYREAQFQPVWEYIRIRLVHHRWNKFYLVFVLLELGVEPGYLLIHRLGSAVHLKISSPSSLELIIIGIGRGKSLGEAFGPTQTVQGL